jgi:hypothetical protein
MSSRRQITAAVIGATSSRAERDVNQRAICTKNMPDEKSAKADCKNFAAGLRAIGVIVLLVLVLSDAHRERLPIVVHADVELMQGGVDRRDGINAMALKIVGRGLEMCLGVLERADRGLNLAMRLSFGRPDRWGGDDDGRKNERAIGGRRRCQRHTRAREQRAHPTHRDCNN